MRALVVDDSRAVRMMLKRMLAELGFDEFSEAGHGGEALQRLDEIEAPDVMLVDWNMPEMNGLEFVKALRSRPEMGHVPVVMVTTETEVGRMSEALASGANEYVMKPFTPEILAQKLNQLGLATS